ncbi:acetyl-CoA carboxyl transferase [Egibacter rhizosphaerae]|uniref:Acetyl-coenzyme A carboxylase carboxyl transferase subunits beta/alpha n=1 Tax=Egibacter rhizosphaerae TaxID=1670831 RepID=A0A411YCY7_9ACTN|nr:carboxyl transferase domain-containing protein [Egibacter rhizosphaerae]QBI19084.1 acetyl-CoA carboxyl transferase [Egibacter rhizosphaerae]
MAGDRAPADELVARTVDKESFEPWDDDVESGDPLGFVDTVAYPDRLEQARGHAGTTEAVVTGEARLRGRTIVVIAGEFAFLAGTMGVATAERVIRALERAANLRAPVLAMPISGGTRMQEGSVAFVQMGAVAAAVRRFRQTGLTYLTYLRDPTTGGVLASWGALGQVRFAEPGALIALTGPRVIEQVTGDPFPDEVLRAEHLRDRGIVDDVVAPEDLADRVDRVLAATQDPSEPVDYGAEPLDLPEDAVVDGWDAVQRSRRLDRPGYRELASVCATDVTPLRGDGAGNDDPGCVTALMRLCGVGVVAVAHDRAPGERGAQLGAAGYRKARRAFALAAELGLPVVTVIDTAGAAMTPEDESGGLAGEIAGCLADLAAVEVPTLSLLLGEGSGGGAIAFLPTDRVVAAEHAWLGPIAPEGASSILYRTTERAPELARTQATSSTDLRHHGIVDVVIPDRPSRDEEGEMFGLRVAATAARELRTLLDQPPGPRLRARDRRWRTLAR